MGDSGDLGECLQAPIARREAPVVCSALAPPGACSQASLTVRKPVELDKSDVLFWHGLSLIAHKSTARKTTVCSNDPATCVRQVN